VTLYPVLVASISMITVLPTIAADAPPVDDYAMAAHLDLMAKPGIPRADALLLAEKHLISKGFDVSSGYAVTAQWQPTLKFWTNDVVRRGNILLEALPRHANGRKRRW
jgi:hypothetical protein